MPPATTTRPALPSGPRGFLTEWSGDLIAAVGLGCTAVGTLLTLVALYVAYLQIRRQADATVAASQAAQAVAADVRRQRNLMVASNARRYFADLKRHVQAGAWDLALVRLVDLREQLAQEGDDARRPATDRLLAELGEHETVFRKIARGNAGLSDRAMGKWLKFAERLSASLDRMGGPIELLPNAAPQRERQETSP